MSDEREITGEDGTTFTASYGRGVPGCALVSVQDGHDWGGGFFTTDQLMAIARLCTELAQEIESAD